MGWQSTFAWFARRLWNGYDVRTCANIKPCKPGSPLKTAQAPPPRMTIRFLADLLIEPLSMVHFMG